MNRLLLSTLSLASAVFILAAPNVCLGQQQPQRQNRGNFDPEQARTRMMERYRTQLDITDDTEWTAIEPRIQKVLDSRRDLGGGMGMMFRGGRGGGPGGNNAQGDATQQTRRGRRNNAGNQDDSTAQARRGPQPSPAAQELQKSIEAKAPADEIKTKLASYREDRKQRQAKLETAQDELRKVLSVRQEASAVLMGLLQ